MVNRYKRLGIYSALSVLFYMLCLNNCNAQDNGVVYEIPFSLETRALVFKGQLNGIETNFAFDTGAAEGVANSKHEKNNRVEKLNRHQKIIDGNGNTASLQNVIIKELSIAGFNFKDVISTLTDMQYLYCMDLYILGADVIRQLNWEIDFEKMVLKVSKNRFATTENMVVIPVSYQSNTTRTSFSINGYSYKNILIDMGFTGELTMPADNGGIKKVLDSKRKQQLVIGNLTASFAVISTPETSLSETIIVDSLVINGHTFYNIPGNCQVGQGFKIGLNFFKTISSKLIINNTDKKFFLQIREQPVFRNFFAAYVLLKDGKLVISSLLVNDTSTKIPLEINEVIKSINGKTALDFGSDCDYINWYYRTKSEKYIIEKNDGQKVTIERVIIKVK